MIKLVRLKELQQHIEQNIYAILADKIMLITVLDVKHVGLEPLLQPRLPQSSTGVGARKCVKLVSKNCDNEKLWNMWGDWLTGGIPALPRVLRNADSIWPPGLSHSPDFHPIPDSDPASPSRDIALEKLNISTRCMLLCPAQERAKSTSSCSWSHAWNHLSYQLGWSLKKDDANAIPIKSAAKAFPRNTATIEFEPPVATKKSPDMHLTHYESLWHLLAWTCQN